MEEINDRYDEGYGNGHDEGYDEGFDDARRDMQDQIDLLRNRLNDLERAIANAKMDLDVL